LKDLNNPRIMKLLHYFLPHKILTFFLGFLAKIRIILIKQLLINAFIKFYGIKLDEALIDDPKKFLNFNEFFIRRLKPKHRPINYSDNVILSPVDGAVADFGKILDGSLIQAKKYKYPVGELLGDETLSRKFIGGSFVTLYLAPTDYHRIHCPLEGKIVHSGHEGNKLYSVNKSSQKLIPSLYIKNERSVLIIDSIDFEYSLISVGASVVGSIVPFWNKSKNPSRNQLIDDWITGPKPNQEMVTRGQELAYFKMGSTVILLFPKSINVDIDSLYQDKIVKFGEALLKISSRDI
jgi:phosphatidylserine decarboxylase